MSLKRIVLFKHGVGYFEREVDVTGRQTLDLHFKATEMNDVLKSLTVIDTGGGRIRSVSYQSTAPVDRQLEGLALRVPPDRALTGLLSQAQGARVEVTVGSQSLAGVVAGIEERTVGDAEHRRQAYQLALLQDGGRLRRVELDDVLEIAFQDEDLQSDLRRLLDIQITAKRKEEKKLSIFCEGEGARNVVVGYVVETPVWKTSYRVLLTADDDRPALVQGWALVDNMQREDWNDVALTLVAGLPISFVHDLYSPRYQERPVVEVQTEAPYAPPELEDAMPRFAAAAAPVAGGAMDELQVEEKAVLRRALRQRGSKQIAQSVQVQTRTVEVGDLLQYTIDHPVTVRQDEAALVPILQESFDGRRVAVWNEAVREKNPMTAVLFKNTTGLTLEGGPITVLEDGEYVGEAMLETIKPDQERFVPYSVELGCRIHRDHRSDVKPVHRVRVADGNLQVHSHRVRRTDYAIRNDTDRRIDLYLEHAFLHGWELEDTPTPHESTENYHRFRVDVPPNETVSLRVQERGDEQQVFAVANVTTEQIAAWAGSGLLDETTKRALEAIAALQAEVAVHLRRKSDAEEAERHAFKDQERLRENLQALGSSDDERRLRTRYVQQLEQAEDTVAGLRREVEQARVQWRELQAQIDDQIRTLDMGSPEA